MNINILYFARIKESLNLSGESIVLSPGINTISALRAHLAQRGEVWQAMFNGKQLVRAAINQELVDDQSVITHGDEVAFFPPVTGG